MPAPVIGKKTQTATEAELCASTAILANRRGMTVQNRGVNVVYVSFTSGALTASTDSGAILDAYEEMSFDFRSPDLPQHVYGACGSGLTTELRIVEW